MNCIPHQPLAQQSVECMPGRHLNSAIDEPAGPPVATATSPGRNPLVLICIGLTSALPAWRQPRHSLPTPRLPSLDVGDRRDVYRLAAVHERGLR
jgi:hypothetical protein